MTPERYQTLLRWLEARPPSKKLVIALNRWLPAVPFACYPLLLVLLNVRWFRLLSANRAAALDFYAAHRPGSLCAGLRLSGRHAPAGQAELSPPV